MIDLLINFKIKINYVWKNSRVNHIIIRKTNNSLAIIKMLPVKLFLFAILIGYLAYKINSNIYVIENFENPLRYKTFYSTLYSIATLVYFLDYKTLKYISKRL